MRPQPPAQRDPDHQAGGDSQPRGSRRWPAGAGGGAQQAFALQSLEQALMADGVEGGLLGLLQHPRQCLVQWIVGRSPSGQSVQPCVNLLRHLRSLPVRVTGDERSAGLRCGFCLGQRTGLTHQANELPAQGVGAVIQPFRSLQHRGQGRGPCMLGAA